MSVSRLTERNIMSGFIYVFFQHADHPEYPSYIRMDLSEGSWSNPVTLTTMRLAMQENGVYACDPRAAVWKDKLYLFGRSSGAGYVEVMATADGENWSDCDIIPRSALTCTAVTPVLWNNNLFYFYSTGDDSIRCDQYDENLDMVMELSASHLNHSVYPLGVSPNLQKPYAFNVFFNNNGTNYCLPWSTSGFEPPYPLGFDLGQGPSPLNCAGGCFLVTRGGGSNRVLYITKTIPAADFKIGIGTPTVIEGVDIYTSPSAVVLDEDGSVATIAVFYVENDDTHALRMAVINIDNSAETATYTLVNLQAIDIPIAGANSSPFALVTP